MSEPTYGSGSSYETGASAYGGGQQYGQQQQGYGGGQQYGQQYQQPSGPPTGGYPQQSGYPAPGSTPTPSPRRAPTDRTALAAQLLTIVGYVLAGLGLLACILLLTVDLGTGSYRFASALQALILGVGLGGLNFAAGTWLGSKSR